jgi:[acyl-carrier-protein] S-malonyltransferase
MFPGQGAQFIGMGSQLVKEFPSTQKLYDQASNIVGYDLLEICAQGPKDRLDSTVCS